MQFNLEEYFYPTPGSKEENKIVIFAHRHWATFLPQMIIACLLFATPIVIVILLDIYYQKIFDGVFKNFLVIFGSVYYLLITTFIFNAWISYYNDIYILTEDLIVDITQAGFFHRKVAQLSLLRVQDVSSSIKGIFPTLFAYGDVLVETAGEHAEEFLLKSIPNPQKFSAKVLEMHNKLVEASGRQKQMAEGEGVVKPKPKEEIETTKKTNIDLERDKIKTAPPEKKEEPSFGQAESRPGAEGEISKDDLGKGGEVKF